MYNLYIRLAKSSSSSDVVYDIAMVFPALLIIKTSKGTYFTVKRPYCLNLNYRFSV